MFLFPPHDLVNSIRRGKFFYVFLLDIDCSGPQPANPSTCTMTRGRLGRKPANRLLKSFLIEKGVKGSQLKKELTLGGRVNINGLDGGLWLNPTVVLRRLTVTIGGFKIELLPGPSYAQSVNTSQSACFNDSISYGGDIGFVLPDDSINVQNPIPENEAKMDIEKSTAEDAALGLGPYVNPNEVQTSNGALTGGPETQETKLDNQSDNPGKQNPVNKEKEDLKQPQNNKNNITTVSNKTDSKEKQEIVAKNLLKSKQGLFSNKNKDISCKTSNMAKEHQVSQNTPSKIIQRGDMHKVKSLKEKKNITPLKRPVENTQSEHATKVQKIQGTGDSKVKSKLPSTPSSVVKKSPSSTNRLGDQQAPAKPTHPQNSSKAETAAPACSRPGHPVKPAEEAVQEKPKLKKPEKLLQRQKSKNSRSISVDEPQLFIPDNAPVVKKEAAEDQSASSETVWDGNNCCGLCKKHHNNM